MPERWVARLKNEDGVHFLGVFKNAEDASAAYEAAAKWLHGDFAYEG